MVGYDKWIKRGQPNKYQIQFYPDWTPEHENLKNFNDDNEVIDASNEIREHIK
jgi:hypothetical protein